MERMPSCRWHELKTNLVSLDELMLKEGDWVDIGEPLVDGQVFPVTVKSLVFHGNSDDRGQMTDDKGF